MFTLACVALFYIVATIAYRVAKAFGYEDPAETPYWG